MDNLRLAVIVRVGYCGRLGGWWNFKLSFASEWDSHTIERCFIRLAGAGPEKEPTPPMELYANDWMAKRDWGQVKNYLHPWDFRERIGKAGIPSLTS